jgi:hypothetical protein
MDISVLIEMLQLHFPFQIKFSAPFRSINHAAYCTSANRSYEFPYKDDRKKTAQNGTRLSSLTQPVTYLLLFRRLCSRYRRLCILHCNENLINVFLFWELRGLSPNFYIHVFLSDLYKDRSQNRQIEMVGI